MSSDFPQVLNPLDNKKRTFSEFKASHDQSDKSPGHGDSVITISSFLSGKKKKKAASAQQA